MPIGTRRQAQASTQTPPEADLPSQEIEGDEQEMEHEEGMIEEEEGEYAEEGIIDQSTFPPPGLKEISSLASWTVSTAKPGNGVAALRSSDNGLFWQSDGPQPHLLSIHFFKLVSIVHMRIFLDFESDESYTPTKIQFLAGMSVHDLQEFAVMSFKEPIGWIPVDFSNVGTVEPDDDEDDEDAVEGAKGLDWSKRPVLRAFLVQVKILENHQNGKDTHLRAVQLFARDEAYENRKAAGPVKPSATTLPVRPGSKDGLKCLENNIKLAPWMMEPDLR